MPRKPTARTVPVASLRAVKIEPFDELRMRRIRKAYRDGRAAELPPIKLVLVRGGELVIEDGQHRLAVARAVGAKTIRVMIRRAARQRRGVLEELDELLAGVFELPAWLVAP